MKEFTKLVFIDTKYGKEVLTVNDPSFIPEVGDRVVMNGVIPPPRIARRHLDYEDKVVYIYVK